MNSDITANTVTAGLRRLVFRHSVAARLTRLSRTDPLSSLSKLSTVILFHCSLIRDLALRSLYGYPLAGRRHIRRMPIDVQGYRTLRQGHDDGGDRTPRSDAETMRWAMTDDEE